MKNEIKSLQENNTWILTELPDDTKALSAKWVFRVKQNADGSGEKYKARLVIKGFKQEIGQTFRPVARMSTIRSLISVATTESLHMLQFDTSTAFLYGELEEVIYMKQPEGFSDCTRKVCQLKISLYGLKQAP